MLLHLEDLDLLGPILRGECFDVIMEGFMLHATCARERSARLSMAFDNRCSWDHGGNIVILVVVVVGGSGRRGCG
jgi:hypothetical protein